MLQGLSTSKTLHVPNGGNPSNPRVNRPQGKISCYVSRELAAMLKEVHVNHDIFPDHAVLYGVFRNLSTISPRFVWPCPKQFPWPASWKVDPAMWTSTPGTPDMKYQAVWTHIETQACAAIPFPVSKNFQGRACTRDTRVVFEGKIPPPKKARKGDVQPHYKCASFRHAQWLRQTRRLQSYLRFVSANFTGVVHARRVWGAIVRSTGFTLISLHGATQ